jgi:hypothetical protein
MTGKGRTSPFRGESGKVRNRRLPAVNRVIGERSVLPQSGRRWFTFKNWIRRIEAETTPPRQVRARAAFVRT